MTQEDIDKGVRCSPRGCPIARQLRKTYPNAFVIFNYWFASDFGVGIPLPFAAKAFIKSFDGEIPVGPETFEIEAPEAP